ncbi:uncharacterized protein LOC106176560 [Lingula anatina]|uniref:Uncharacterized protein LOC106176560 n=1 Tax=Lingula anatina TaxID=7574 RepID=A0A1S3JVY7_LINAN|nr:uncharacterized protein LOC106176560 [Lingula anatina]|eukprot:XP_013414457.1 uncharacterized protein LOC106176560 [Lingula anatina]
MSDTEDDILTPLPDPGDVEITPGKFDSAMNGEIGHVVRKGSLFGLEQKNPTLFNMENFTFSTGLNRFGGNRLRRESEASEAETLPELSDSEDEDEDEDEDEEDPPAYKHLDTPNEKTEIEKPPPFPTSPPPSRRKSAMKMPKEQGVKPKGPAAKLWDIFRITSPDNEELSESWCLEVTKRVCKVIVYWLLLFFILGSTVIHKITLMISVAQSRTEKWLTCEVDMFGNLTNCIVDPGVHKNTNLTDRVRCDEVSVRWIWGLAATMCFPYLLTFMQCLFKVLFKVTLWPSLGTFFALERPFSTLAHKATVRAA